MRLGSEEEAAGRPSRRAGPVAPSRALPLLPLVLLVSPLQSAAGLGSQSPGRLEFADTDVEALHVDGSITLLAAADEAAVSRYSVHFASAPEGPPLGAAAADFPAGTPSALLSRRLQARLPSGIAAGADFYLIVFTWNATGRTYGLSTRCRDLAVPTELAGGVSFFDTDPRPGLLGGVVTILRAADETSLESYVAKLAVREVAAQGALRWRWVRDLGEVLKTAFVQSSEAAQVCRCAPLGQGSVCASTLRLVGEALPLPDCARRCEAAPQCEHFVAGRAGSPREGRCYQVSGPCATLDPNPAYDAFALTHGIVRIQGSGSAGVCECGTVLGTLQRTMMPVELSVAVAQGTPIVGATHIVVLTSNGDGDMSQGRQPVRWVSVPLTDLAAPVTPVRGLTFQDEDAGAGALYGHVRFTPAGLHHQVSEYRVYLAAAGDSGRRVQPLARLGPIARLPAPPQPPGGQPLQLSALLGRPCPGPNASGMGTNASGTGSGTGAAVGTCIALPVVPTETSPGVLGATNRSAVNGSATNGSAANGSAANGSATNGSAANGSAADESIANGSATGTSAAGSVAWCACGPAAATHVLVRPAGSDGELEGAGRHTKLVDRTGGPPQVPVTDLVFADADDNPGLVAGTAQIRVPVPEPRDVAAYRIYFQAEDGRRVERARSGGRPPWLAEAVATGFDLGVAVESTIVPGTARRLVAVALNADGEGPLGRGVAIRDVGTGSGEWRSPILMIVLISSSTLVCCCCTTTLISSRSRIKTCLLEIWKNEADDGQPSQGGASPKSPTQGKRRGEGASRYAS